VSLGFGLSGKHKGKVGVLLVAQLVLCRCAGPATPLGGVWGIEVSQVAPTFGEELAEAATVTDESGGPKIRFNPPRQVLHAPKPMTLVIEDPHGTPNVSSLRIRYNGLDVTRSFLRQARVKSRGAHKLVVQIPRMSLPPTSDHAIEVRYVSGKGTPLAMSVLARYEAPVCSIFDSHRVLSTDNFEPEQRLIHSIERISEQNGFSPAFSTALIAQESSFNPKTVSSAGAMGLTQVTPVAEEDLQELIAHWPRYPGVDRLPSPLVRFLVMSGDINERNEWRLQPERSIRGGLTYLRVLAEKWSMPENMARIRAIIGDNPKKIEEEKIEIMQTKLILASYNSGFARVQSSLLKNGRNWLKSSELKEARRYVNSIFSYCDSFSQPEVDNENEA
jgi:hypothetical protein